MSKEDILELKPGLYGVSLNLRALFRRLKGNSVDPLLVVPSRVFQVFDNHGVAVSQIPRLIPELSLSQLRSLDTLLNALTPDIIQKIANLFGVQRKWLEGTTDVIYDGSYYCYKDPWKFFKEIETFKIEPFEFPLIAFTAESKFDYTSGRDQFVLLVQREKCAELDDKTIYRYRIIDQFLWGYFKSRTQLKAMMRIWYLKYQIPVSIFRVDKETLKFMEAGKIVPHKHMWGSRRSKHENLEDYALTPAESRVSKEEADLPEVFEYIKLFKLDNMEGENPIFSHETAVYQ
jgi:hypothetical protein